MKLNGWRIVMKLKRTNLKPVNDRVKLSNDRVNSWKLIKKFKVVRILHKIMLDTLNNVFILSIGGVCKL